MKENSLKENVLVKENYAKSSSSRIYNQILTNRTNEINSGIFRYKLYRFLTDSIPAVNSCINTWVRLSAAPGRYRSLGNNSNAEKVLGDLYENINWEIKHRAVGVDQLLPFLFTSLFRDGLFSGFLLLNKNRSGIEKFVPLDNMKISFEEKKGIVYSLGEREVKLDFPDFYLMSINNDLDRPLGRSILQSVPFVSYVEQQLVEDMRRSTHNSGYHRLHVKITPPERIGGESDNKYIDRINHYFDSTVSMIKNCEVDENPVTWDNVQIETIGPENVRTVTNSWFLNHRSMIEEICAGTNLAPFLLGYSFGATSSWASFKFDIVMRQVRSIQNEAASFLEWLGNIELALKGIKDRCKFEFDNNFSYQAIDNANIKSKEIDNILKLYQNDLIDKDDARAKIAGLI